MTNKSQELAIMRMKAKIRVQELRKQHDQAWNGQDPVVIDRVEEEEDGANT